MAASLPSATSQHSRPRPLSIGDLITSAQSVPATTPISAVVRTFDAQPELDALAVIDGAVIRIVVRSRFFLQLGRRFGDALCANRPIRLLAEEGSTVDATECPVEVITLAMQREASRIYDDIVVVEKGRFRGLVSMRQLLAHHKDLLVSSMA